MTERPPAYCYVEPADLRDLRDHWAGRSVALAPRDDILKLCDALHDAYACIGNLLDVLDEESDGGIKHVVDLGPSTSASGIAHNAVVEAAGLIGWKGPDTPIRLHAAPDHRLAGQAGGDYIVGRAEGSRCGTCGGPVDLLASDEPGRPAFYLCIWEGCRAVGQVGVGPVERTVNG